MNRSVELFAAAYEEQSFTAAAERAGATQSGVSQHIRKLERRFGVKLFRRQGKGVVPTPAGDRYYDHCLRLLRAINEADQDMQDLSGALFGDLRVGMMPSLTAHVLGAALLQFRSEHPNVCLDIVEGFSGPLTKLTWSGEIDFAIVPNFPEIRGLRVSYFATTPELLIYRRDRFGGAPPLGDWNALGPLNVILPKPHNVRNQTLRSYFTANGIEIKGELEIDTMMATLDLVAQSDWVAIVPALMISNQFERIGLGAMQLPGRGLDLDLVVTEPASASLSASALAFLEVLKRETTRINEYWLPRGS